MNDVAPLVQMKLPSANDVMLRINDIALRTNGYALRRDLSAKPLEIFAGL